MKTLLKDLAIQFDLQRPDGTECSVIAWIEPDGNAKHLVPTHPDHVLLDVKAGDRVTFSPAPVYKKPRRKPEVLQVVRIKPYRSRLGLPEDQYDWIESVREFVERQD